MALNPLGWSVRDTIVIDVLRAALVLFIAVLTGYLAATMRRRDVPAPARRPRRILFSTIIAMNCYVGLTEAGQIGKPFLVWRLPCAVLTEVIVVRMLAEHYRVWHVPATGTRWTEAARDPRGAWWDCDRSSCTPPQGPRQGPVGRAGESRRHGEEHGD